MARTVKPGSPVTSTAPQYQVKIPDFKQLDKLGDAKVKAGLQSFEVYADTLIKTESAKLYQQFHNDPIQLSNGFTKLGSMLDGLPEELQDKYRNKMYLTGVALVQKAQQNQIEEQDAQTKVNADTNTEISKQLLAQSYQNVLKNATAKKEDYDEVANSIFLQQVMTLNDIADLKDATGRNMYSESQRKKIRNIDDLELEGFKQFFDAMLINDNDKLDASTEYYQKYLLAPERFMKDNYMNRETYDKVRAYAEKELKRAGAEIQKMKFKQTAGEYMELQGSDLPGVRKALKESGFPREMINKLEKTNLKFDEIDPSKPVNPVAMLDMLQIVNSWDNKPFANTEEEKLETLMQGTIALDTMADVLKKYGGSPKDVERARKMVVMKEQNRMYGAMLKNFGEITQSFGTSIPDMDKKLAVIRGEKPQGVRLTDDELERLGRLNDTLAKADDLSREALRRGDSYYAIQNQLYKEVAQIKYDKIITAPMWAEWEKNPDKPIELPGGRFVKVIGFTDVGDIITEE